MSTINTAQDRTSVKACKSSLWAHIVTEQICDRVKQILDKIIQVSQKNSQITLPKSSEDLIRFSIERALIRWFWLDKIFSPTYIEDSISKLWKDMISIVVYDNDNNVEYANDAYINATKLWIDEIKALSKEKNLYNTIYEWKALEKVLDLVGQLERWELPEGYKDEDFPMKTGKILKWNTKKNVRVWIDVSWIKWNDRLLKCSDTPVKSVLNYNNIVNLFNIQLNQIIDSVPWLSAWLDKAWFSKELDINFELLRKFSLIWDIIINFWPLPVFFQHDVEMFVNKRFVELSWYKYNDWGWEDDLYTHMNSWYMFAKLLWQAQYDSLQQRIDILAVWSNLTEMHTITRKWWEKVDVLWNIFKFEERDDRVYDSKPSTFWSWIITSPISENNESSGVKDAIWDSFFNFDDEVEGIDDLLK